MKHYFEIGRDIARGMDGYVMSRTDLVGFAENPWSWRKGKRFVGTDATKWGSLIDCMYLTPELFGSLYAIQPAKYPAPTNQDPGKMNDWSPMSNWCKAWTMKQRHAGLETVSKKWIDEAKKALAVLQKHPEAVAFREASKTQTICQWEYTDPETGIVVPCKCMIDMDGDGFLADFKTARNGDPDGFKRSAKKLRYDIQGAFYNWGYRECHKAVDNFAFIVSENETPYPVDAYYLDEFDLGVGREGLITKWVTYEGYESMLARYCRCLADDLWPGNTEGIQPLNIFS